MRAFTNILVEEPAASAGFFCDLLGLQELFAADWFVLLGESGVELGLLKRDHDSVPKPFRAAPSGVILTFVVADCDAAHDRAKRLSAEIVEPPRDMPYGQRRMLIRSPDGALIDISAPTAPPPGG